MTTEEALAEAQRRWGPEARVTAPEPPISPYYHLFIGATGYWGHSWHDLFERAEHTIDIHRRPALATWSRLEDGRLRLIIRCRLCDRHGTERTYDSPAENLHDWTMTQTRRAVREMRTDRDSPWLCEHLSCTVYVDRSALGAMPMLQ